MPDYLTFADVVATHNENLVPVVDRSPTGPCGTTHRGRLPAICSATSVHCERPRVGLGWL